MDVILICLFSLVGGLIFGVFIANFGIFIISVVRRFRINSHKSYNLPEILKFEDYTVYLLGGLPHRKDGPAIEWTNGDREWYINGELHREDGPAVENSEGYKWYFHGKLHREDGPAIELNNGHTEWYVEGVKQHIPPLN